MPLGSCLPRSRCEYSLGWVMQAPGRALSPWCQAGATPRVALQLPAGGQGLEGAFEMTRRTGTVFAQTEPPSKVSALHTFPKRNVLIGVLAESKYRVSPTAVEEIYSMYSNKCS